MATVWTRLLTQASAGIRTSRTRPWLVSAWVTYDKSKAHATSVSLTPFALKTSYKFKLPAKGDFCVFNDLFTY